MSQSNQPQQAKYFNLHTSGLGYCNRIRDVPVKRGESFVAMSIAALHGHSDDVQYTYFDCRVSGKQAKAVLEQIRPMIEDKQNKVLISFKIGDLYAEPFVYKTGAKAGETGISLKARLLRIDWVSVNGHELEIEIETETDLADAA